MPISSVLSDPGRHALDGPESRLSGLPPFPAAATKLLRLSEQKDVELRSIKPVLASDPSLAADVLRLANSPLFTIRNEIRSVEHAVVLLGLERIKTLAVAIAMRRYSTGAGDGVYRKCWEHSLACAVVSEELAEFYTVSREDGYTAGLVHDIGRVGLLKAYSKEYIPVLKTEYEELDESLALEQCLLRTNHCLSGSFLGKTWQFPRYLQIVAEGHHSIADVNEPKVVSLTRVACALTDALGFAEIRRRDQTGIESALQLLDGAAADPFARRLAFVQKRIEEKIAYFHTA